MLRIKRGAGTKMRRLITLRRIFVQALHNFFRNAWLSTAATAVMVVTLTIILSSVVINMALTDTINDIASHISVSVYLKDKVEEAKRLELEQELRQNDNVESIRYVSKEEALAIFQDLNKDDPTILSGIDVTDNILPASYEIKVKDLSRLDEVTSIANDKAFSDIVDETSVSEERRKSIDNIAKAQDFIVISSVVAASIFAGISVLVIFNTIRMAVYTRQQEIEIMKLIGATPSYIRGPFLFEASFYGVVAGLLASVTVYSTLNALGPRANKQLLIEPTITYFANHFALIVLATVLTGVAIGLISSYISTRRYLHLKRW